VLLPAADPKKLVSDAAPTPEAVEEQVEYVYLFLVVVPKLIFPNANIPRVLFPAADPQLAAALAVPTPEAVDASDAYVYLFLTLVLPEAVQPKAKIALFPSFKQQPLGPLNNPNPRAEAAPVVSINGIATSLKLSL
jgi:hypothetical protein